MPFEPITTPAEIDAEINGFTDNQLEQNANRVTPELYRKSWASLTDMEKTSLRASNMLTGRKRAADLQAKQTAETRSQQASTAQRAAAAKEQYRVRARGFFPGDDDEFKAAFDTTLWPHEQIRLMNEGMIETEQAARARINSVRLTD